MFHSFRRRQEVTHCWRRVNGRWCVQDIAFIDEWTEKDYAELIASLQNTVSAGGAVFAAFDNTGSLKGFASVKADIFGADSKYMDLSNLHVSEEMRRNGIGRRLFQMAGAWAKEKGAEKLYISAHSAVESQAFYRALGCVEAQEYQQAHVEKEPCDCQMEYAL